MKPLMLAGHPALEFLNSTMAPRGEPTELIGDGRAFVRWLVDAEWIDSAAAAQLVRRFGDQLDEIAAEARQIRGWAIEWIAKWSTEPGARYAGELRRLNELLVRADAYRQVRRDGDALAIVEQHRGEAPGELIGMIAVALAELVTREQPVLVKRCEGSGCTLWFVDRTKAHRRRFCSAAACGNRDKVAAFRARQRDDD